MPRITETFDLYTPESIENGDSEDCGFIDEEGYEIEPDEDQTLVEATIEYLKGKYVDDPSSSHFHPGIWYTAHNANEGTRDNIELGHTENRSFHLKDFTPEQEREIARGMGVRE